MFSALVCRQHLFILHLVTQKSWILSSHEVLSTCIFQSCHKNKRGKGEALQLLIALVLKQFIIFVHIFTGEYVALAWPQLNCKGKLEM